MNRQAYRYEFTDQTSLADVKDSLFLAIFAAEGVHGRAQVRLDVGFCLDEKARACVVDAGTAVGKTVAQIFTGLLTRQVGEGAFTVEHVFGEPIAGAGASP